MDDLNDVVSHYGNMGEEDRLGSGVGKLEFVRTREILERYLPPPPGRVLDIGGGTGVHAAWLADEGYQVHIVDLTPRHVELVRSTLTSRGVTTEVGDARSLSQPAGTFDVTLLLGPMYHLPDESDRITALRNAVRVTRQGGVVAVAAINRFASLFDGLTRGLLLDDRFREIVEGDLRDGRHRNPTNEPHWFTTAYFHHPEELRAEAEAVGLEVLALLGVEGPAGWLGKFDQMWSTPEGRDAILYAASAVESEGTLSGLSAHLLMMTRVRGF